MCLVSCPVCLPFDCALICIYVMVLDPCVSKSVITYLKCTSSSEDGVAYCELTISSSIVIVITRGILVSSVANRGKIVF